MSNPNDRTAFARARREAGLSQEALAREADCSVAWVRMLDSGLAPDPERSPAYLRCVEVLRERSSAR